MSMGMRLCLSSILGKGFSIASHKLCFADLPRMFVSQASSARDLAQLHVQDDANFCPNDSFQLAPQMAEKRSTHVIL